MMNIKDVISYNSENKTFAANKDKHIIIKCCPTKQQAEKELVLAKYFSNLCIGPPTKIYECVKPYMYKNQIYYGFESKNVGVTLRKNLSIELLDKFYMQINSLLYKIAKRNVILLDLNLSNLVYDNNLIYFIDFDPGYIFSHPDTTLCNDVMRFILNMHIEGKLHKRRYFRLQNSTSKILKYIESDEAMQHYYYHYFDLYS